MTPQFSPDGGCVEASVSRAFRALLVYTSACAQAAINLGTDTGNKSLRELSPILPESFTRFKSPQRVVLPVSYLALSPIHSC